MGLRYEITCHGYVLPVLGKNYQITGSRIRINEIIILAISPY